MSKQHLSRLKSPKSWLIKKKGIKWVIKPSAGPHRLETCLPLGIIIREILLLSKTTKESKKILNDKQVLVNGIIRKTIKFPVGLMDIITFPMLNKHYRVLIDKKGKLILNEIKKEDGNILYNKIKNKTILKNKKIQLNFFDGGNKIVDKDIYKPGDTIITSLNKNEIKKHLKLEKGTLVYIIKGKHIGEMGTLEGLHKFESGQPNKLIIKLKDRTIEILKDCIFVIDKPIF